MSRSNILVEAVMMPSLTVLNCFRSEKRMSDQRQREEREQIKENYVKKRQDEILCYLSWPYLLLSVVVFQRVKSSSRPDPTNHVAVVHL
jgi:hypothetical protein